MKKLFVALIVVVLQSCMFAHADARFIPRPDENGSLDLRDVDVFDGRIRMLIETRPSNEQFMADREGWRKRLYVFEIGRDGTTERHDVHSTQGQLVPMLRRGAGDVVWIEYQGLDTPKRIKAWSLNKARLISDEVLPSSQLNVRPTSDGHFVIVEAPLVPGNHKGPVGSRWTKFSSAGEVLGRGSLDRPDAVLNQLGAFEAKDGGIGIVLLLMLPREGPSTLDTDAEVPILRQVLNRTIEGRVGSETRLLLADSDAQFSRLSTALERGLVWDGDTEGLLEEGTAAFTAYGEKRGEIDAEVGVAYGTNRSLRSLPLANAPAVKPTRAGYGMFIDHSAFVDWGRTARGLHFFEVDESGEQLRDVHLEPAAEALKARFTDFLELANGELALLTEGKQLQVSYLNTDGSLKSVQTLGAYWQPLGIIGSADHMVVFGTGENAGHRQLWWEKVDPDQASSDVPRPITPEPERVPVAQTQTLPGIPDVPGGCACTCAELSAIEAFTRQMQSTSDPALLQSMSQSDEMEKLMCQATCMLEYQKCR